MADLPPPEEPETPPTRTDLIRRARLLVLPALRAAYQRALVRLTPDEQVQELHLLGSSLAVEVVAGDTSQERPILTMDTERLLVTWKAGAVVLRTPTEVLHLTPPHCLSLEEALALARRHVVSDDPPPTGG